MTLALRDLEGRPDDEIALALGAERPSVPALVARARLRLRAELALPTESAGCAGHLADLSAYADGTLPPEGRAALETHLEGVRRLPRRAVRAARGRTALPRRCRCPCRPASSARAWRQRSAQRACRSGARRGVRRSRCSHLRRAGSRAPARRPRRRPAPARRPADGGRQTAAAIAMAALVLIGIVVTLVARDSGGPPAARSAPAAPAATAPAAGGNAQGTAGTPATHAPRSSRRREAGAGAAAPPKIRHVRSGTRVYPHRSLPVQPRQARPRRARARRRPGAGAGARHDAARDARLERAAAAARATGEAHDPRPDPAAGLAPVHAHAGRCDATGVQRSALVGSDHDDEHVESSSLRTWFA